MTVQSSRPGEIKALAGARAIPPLILVLYHYCEGHHYRNFKPFDLLIGHGYMWVEFFFALSGFILTYVYGARVIEFFRGHAYKDFLVARLARLYPLHIAMLLWILVVMLLLNSFAHATGGVSIYEAKYHPVVTWQTFIANIFLVQAWNIFPYLSWNGASWFVSVEFLLCLLFPVYLLLARGGWASAIGLIAAGIAGLWYLSATGKHGLDITFHNGIFRGMSAFAAGVGMCVLYQKTRAVADQMPEIAISIMQLIVLVWMGFGTFDNGWSHTPRDIYTVLPMLWLVYVLSFDRGFAARFMQLPILQKLGEWSFAIYIGQTVWLQLIRFFESGYPADDTLIFGIRFGDLIWWPEPFALLLVCVVWGWFLCTTIELPANRAIRRYFGRKPAVA
ncbi:MAG: acyltransferase [Alphaproteobacteria bacterium]|nr:acyltransferase [Alphaproteobacteria bacterium]MBL6937097.1 acyltransferase [Alphaproteobacteria bacterium]MBL7096341.1 acyltransferase [Alphaproteobacteria bacterium]